VLQWGHDEGVVEGMTEEPDQGPMVECFNGATTKASWKALGDGWQALGYSTLQWGHDEGVVEGPTTSACSTAPCPSFNGATTKASWKATKTYVELSNENWLQWGHDEGVVEGETATQLLRDGHSLQWGHDEGVVEGAISLPSETRLAGLQWGHDEGVVEGSRIRRLRSAFWSCFNGATTKASWKAWLFCGNRRPFPRLQWGHDEGVVEGGLRCLGRRRGFSASMGPRRRRRGRRRLRAAAVPDPGRFNGATTKASWKAQYQTGNS